jgi:leucyl aminopeptidase (aminopeptidase T)
MMQRSILLVLGGACVAAAGSAQQPRKPDLRAIAHQLIASAMLQEGQSVLITGSVRDAGLMEDLAIEAQKVGAQPLLALSSERLIRRSYDEVPAKYDGQEPKLDRAVAKLFDAQIAIDFGESEGLLAGVPPERIAARAKAGAPVFEVFLKRNVHFVNLGNGLYPTATLAKRLGITQTRLASGFWKAVAVPPERIQVAGEQLRTAFASGGTAQLTHPNGTSLTFDVTGRTPTISAGALTQAQGEQGGAALLTWLPAGEFQIAAVPGSAEGKIVIDKSLFRGKEIRGLTLVFSQGKLTSMTAASGFAPLKTAYDAAGSGKDRFGLIDIGLNPEVDFPLTTGAIVWPEAGAVTVVFGNDVIAGGSNNSDFSFAAELGGASITVGGKPVVEKGRLK